MVIEPMLASGGGDQPISLCSGHGLTRSPEHLAASEEVPGAGDLRAGQEHGCSHARAPGTPTLACSAQGPSGSFRAGVQLWEVRVLFGTGSTQCWCLGLGETPCKAPSWLCCPAASGSQG